MDIDKINTTQEFKAVRKKLAMKEFNLVPRPVEENQESKSARKQQAMEEFNLCEDRTLVANSDVASVISAFDALAVDRLCYSPCKAKGKRCRNKHLTCQYRLDGRHVSPHDEHA